MYSNLRQENANMQVMLMIVGRVEYVTLLALSSTSCMNGHKGLRRKPFHAYRARAALRRLSTPFPVPTPRVPGCDSARGHRRCYLGLSGHVLFGCWG